MSNTPNYDIDKEAIKSGIDAQRDTAKAEMGGIYDEAIKNNNSTMDSLKDDIDANKDELQRAQEESHKATVDAIEQNKEWANKDYIKEQSGAYTDWQKQSNQYGVDAERMASNGLTNTGFSESSQVSMYNQYQNRVATARESYQRAVTEYNLAIAEAKVQNSVALAEIASQALAQALEVTITFATQNNSLLTQKASALAQLDQNYYNRYLAELEQINAENTLAEQVRQHNEEMAFEREKFDWTKSQAEKSSGGGGGGGGIKGARSPVVSAATGVIAPTGSRKDKETEKEETNNEPKPNMDSVMKLGFGAMDAERLNELVKRGYVKEYEIEGQLYYEWTSIHSKVQYAVNRNNF